MADSLAQAKYAAMIWNTPLSEAHANDLLQHLNLPQANSIVDIGCGWGELLLRAASLAGPHIKATGIDTDQLLLDRAKRNAQERGINAEFTQQRGEDFQGTADRAICLGSSHTLGGTQAMLSRLAEIVPKGRVLVGDMFWEKPPTEEAKEMFSDEALPLADLAALCREAGWKVLS
ncbi:class I SAM-dependent methyltransferase, partial [Candidatus Bathyarchaeota archaeon]|nr:class I SAM-dependent methyltransferase [Candidatus Bathyarchaeota archaeon]